MTTFLLVFFFAWAFVGAAHFLSSNNYGRSGYNIKQKLFVIFMGGPFAWICLALGLIFVLVGDSYDWALEKLK